MHCDSARQQTGVWWKCLLLVLWIYKDFTDTLASASPLLSYYHPATSQEVITLISGPFTSKEYQLRIPLSLHRQALMFPNEKGGNGSVVSWYSKITSLYFLSVRAALQSFWSTGSFPLMHSANFSQQPLRKVWKWVCVYVCVQPMCYAQCIASVAQLWAPADLQMLNWRCTDHRDTEMEQKGWSWWSSNTNKYLKGFNWLSWEMCISNIQLFLMCCSSSYSGLVCIFLFSVRHTGLLTAAASECYTVQTSHLSRERRLQALSFQIRRSIHAKWIDKQVTSWCEVVQQQPSLCW